MMLDVVMHLQLQINNGNVGQIPNLDRELEKLRQSIANTTDGCRYQAAMELLTRKLDDLKREEEVLQLEKSVKDFEKEVLNITIPVFKNPVSLFEKHIKKVVKLEELLDSHKQCAAINSLRQDVKDIKIKIESLDKDNKIALGWLGTSTTLTAASIGVAFIPVVGLPIAAGMNVVPYFGRLAHRLVESSNRRETFRQNDG